MITHTLLVFCFLLLVALLFFFTANVWRSYQHRAIKKGRTELTKKDVERLHLAVYAGNEQLVLDYISKGIDINVRDGSAVWTPLFRAVIYDWPQVAVILINHGADLDALDLKNFTALTYASMDAKVNLVSLLVSSGANVNLGAPPLVWACDEDNPNEEMRLKIVQELIDAGADVGARDKYGATALMRARTNNYTSIATLLEKLEQKANVQMERFFDAILDGNVELVKTLIAQGVNVNAREKEEGASPLMAAATHGQSQIALLLIEHGANINALHDLNWTPLTWASVSVDVDMVRLLLAKGANVNLGYSALILVCDDYYQKDKWEHALEVVQELIEAGANVKAKDRRGRTALDLARAHEQTLIVAMLEQHLRKEL